MCEKSNISLQKIISKSKNTHLKIKDDATQTEPMLYEIDNAQPQSLAC